MPEPALRWSIRASFFQYVARLHDGRASVSSGATLTTDDPQLVVYPADPELTTDTELAFRGDLRLAGHGGLLFVRLAQPRIEVAQDGGRSVLTVDDPLTEDGTGPRLRLVTADLTQTGAWTGTDVRLTAEGVALFNHVYQVDEVFDSFEIADGPVTR